MRRVARASMRPSWPPPRTPMVDPGGRGEVGLIRRSPRGAIRRLRPWTAVRPGRRRVSRRVGDSPSQGGPRRRGPHWSPRPRRWRRSRRWDSGGHLDDREEESTPLRVRDFTGTASTGTEVRAEAMPGRWAAPPAPGDDQFQSTFAGRFRVGEKQLGGAVGADDFRLVRNAEVPQDLGGPWRGWASRRCCP